MVLGDGLRPSLDDGARTRVNQWERCVPITAASFL